VDRRQPDLRAALVEQLLDARAQGIHVARVLEARHADQHRLDAVLQRLDGVLVGALLAQQRGLGELVGHQVRGDFAVGEPAPLGDLADDLGQRLADVAPLDARRDAARDEVDALLDQRGGQAADDQVAGAHERVQLVGSDGAQLARRRAGSRLDVGHDLARQVEVRGRAAVADRQRQALGVHARHDALDAAVVGAGEAVDRLALVADEDHPPARRAAAQDELELGRAEVLRFVDEDPLELLQRQVPRHRQVEHVVEVDAALAPRQVLPLLEDGRERS